VVEVSAEVFKGLALALLVRRGMRRTEDDVEDGVCEGGVGGVAVGFPILCVVIELDVTSDGLSVELDGAIGEVGSGSSVPVAEVDEFDGLLF